MPSWPTFGIQLEPALPALPDSLVFLPQEYGQGIADTWDRFDQKARSAAKFGGFLASIIGAMQNWNDNTLARSAGVRDRVVRLRLKPKEGGLNLDMRPPLISAIATRGQEAAESLSRRFLPAKSSPPQQQGPVRVNLLPGANGGPWQGWDFQRWVRLDVLIKTLGDKAPGLVHALSSETPYALSYDALLKKGQSQAPPGHAAPLSEAEAQGLADLLKALDRVSADVCNQTAKYPGEAIPDAEIAVRPLL